MKTLNTYICGPTDTQNEMERVRNTVDRLNGSLSQQVRITLDVHCWIFEESGFDTQNKIFNKISAADLVIFIFSRRLGLLTPIEFQVALKGLFQRGQPSIKVWFKYVPDDFNIDPGQEYKRLLDFKTSLGELPPHGLLYHTFQSDDPVAESFVDNTRLATLETLVFQEFTPFLLKKAGFIESIITDKMDFQLQETISREMISNHWAERAHRPDIGAIMSSRYQMDKLKQASDQLVNFTLQKVNKYISEKKVVELGSGIGRFTMHLYKQSKHLTTVDMSPEMTMRAKKLLGKEWENIVHFDSFVEDLPELGNDYDCVFSCLFFIHIINESDLRQAARKIKACANIIIIFEHTDPSMQEKVSNFTRLWPRSKYEELFCDEFEEIESYDYNYLGDDLELIVFKRRAVQKELQQKTAEILKHALRRKDADASITDSWGEWYHLSHISDLTIPYEQLLGSFEKGAYEFLHNQTNVVQYPNLRYKLPEDIRRDQDKLTKKIVQAIVKKGDYIPVNEMKSRVDKIQVREVDPISSLPAQIKIHLRPVNYFDYLIVKDRLNDPNIDLRKSLTAFKPTSLNVLENLKTSNIGGCGVFILTRDNNIILSLRQMVAEYPGVISYSASGSMSWYYPGTTDIEANPFLTIMRETYEELGIQIEVEDLRLFAVGIDIKAFFVQFSFYVRTNMSTSEILAAWQGSHARYEITPFAIPLMPKKIAEIIQSYGMEPSAAAALIQLASKLFGKNSFKQHLQD